jgi:hypothetical protein
VPFLSRPSGASNWLSRVPFRISSCLWDKFKWNFQFPILAVMSRRQPFLGFGDSILSLTNDSPSRKSFLTTYSLPAQEQYHLFFRVVVSLSTSTHFLLRQRDEAKLFVQFLAAGLLATTVKLICSTSPSLSTLWRNASINARPTPFPRNCGSTYIRNNRPCALVYAGPCLPVEN